MNHFRPRDWFLLVPVCAFFVFPSSARSDTIDAESTLNKARILIDAGQVDSAREMLTAYLKTAAGQKDYAEYLMALTSFSDTDPQTSLNVVDRFRRKFPDSKFSPLALFKLGQYCRVTLRNPAMAVSTYSKFLKEYPSDPLSRDAHLWLASALIDLGEYERSVGAIHQAMAVYDYGPQEKRILQGLLDFARQSTGQTTSSIPGGVTIDVRPPPSEKSPPSRPLPPFPPADAPPIRRSSSVPFPPVSSTASPAARPFPPIPPAADTSAAIQMNFRDADIDDVLNTLSDELGLTFIKDADVRGKVTVINPRPMSSAEALHLLESILELKDIAMVRSGNVYKVIPLNKSFSKGVEVYASDQGAPMEDRPVTKVIRLSHAQASDVVGVLQPLLGSSGRIKSEPAKNSIVVTGISSNISRLEAIARMLDEAGSTDQHESFKLKFLSSAEALPLVQKLLSASQPDAAGSLKFAAGPTGSHIFCVGPLDMIFKARDVLKLVDVPGYKEESLKVYALRQANAEKLAAFLETLTAKGLAGADPVSSRPGVVSADRMSNSIIVLGSLAFHDILSPLIERLDYEGFAAFRVQIIPLKYANAPDLASKFENIVARGFGVRGEAFTEQMMIQADARLNALILASGSQSLLKTLGSLAAALDRPTEDAGPRTVVYYLENADASKLVGVLDEIFEKGGAAGADATKVVADKGTNSLVIVASRENYDAVMETVMKLDISTYQVLVEAVILEVMLDDAANLGVDWTYRNSNVDFDLKTSGVTLENLALNGIKQAVVKDKKTLDGLIHALLTKTNTRVLSNPRIFAANNQEASILIGDQVPVKTATSVTTGGVTQNTYEYRDVGIKLNVTPHINRRRQTALDIQQEIKTISPTSTSSENPTFQTREARTNAILSDGQTVIIGGLIRTEKKSSVKKVPVVGDIPFFGNAFRRRTESDARTELMIFITPTVVETEAEMAAAVDAQKRAAEKAGLGRTDVEFDSPVRPGFIRDFILK